LLWCETITKPFINLWVTGEMEIRKDFLSVAEFIERLIGYGEAFAEYDSRWSHLKNKEDFDCIYQFDWQDKAPLEKIYSDGRECAGGMASQLLSFNYSDKYPTLTHFINSIEGGWVSEVEELKDATIKAKKKCQEIGCNLWSIGEMIDLFEEQIKLLEATGNTLKILKGSRLYKIENGEISLEDDEQGSIASQNQSGGITAETVNIGEAGNFGHTQNKISANMGWLVGLAAVATIVGTIIAILQFSG